MLHPVIRLGLDKFVLKFDTVQKSYGRSWSIWFVHMPFDLLYDEVKPFRPFIRDWGIKGMTSYHRGNAIVSAWKGICWISGYMHKGGKEKLHTNSTKLVYLFMQ